MKGSAKRPGGSWISQNYEKLALVAALAILLISALLLVLQIGGQRRKFEQRMESEAGQASSRGTLYPAKGQRAAGKPLLPAARPERALG